MKTRRRDYGSPPPPPAKKPRKIIVADAEIPAIPGKSSRNRAPKKARTRPERTRALPYELLELVLMHAIDKANEEIKEIKQLPANGSARRNRLLSELLSDALNSEINHFLKKFKWEMLISQCLGVSSIQRLMIDYSELWANTETIPALERLTEEFEENKLQVKTLHVALILNSLAIPSRLLQLIRQVFESAPKDRMREVTVCLTLSRTGNEVNPVVENSMRQIDRLMMVIPTFSKLTTFKFVADSNSQVSESCPAFIIQQLPKLHTIILHGCSGRQNLIEYPAKLGETLASRKELKYLNMRSMHTFTSEWLDIDWQAPLEELTVQIEQFNPEVFFDETQLLRFCHIFHRTLISLYLERGDLNHPQRARDVNLALTLAQQFESLRYLTYQGHPEMLWAFSRSPNLEQLTWLLVYDSLHHLELFKEHYFPTAKRWRSLKRLNVPEFLRRRPLTMKPCEELRMFLRERAIELGTTIELEYLTLQGLMSMDVAGEFHNLNSVFYPRPILLPLGL